MLLLSGFIGKGGFSRKAAAIVSLASSLMAVHASAQDSCGLSAVKQTVELVYPPIAKAAHIEGTVILLVTFALDGSVTRIKDVSGPQMLHRTSEQFVNGWRANPYGGSRECPIVLTFALGGESEHPQVWVKRFDPQHVRIVAETAVLTVMYSKASH